MAGQTRVTVRPGIVSNPQIADALLVTGIAVQASLPVAVTELLMEQEFNGATKPAVKLLKAPGARLGRIKTVLSWLLTTTTFFRVTLPGLLTVPV